MTHPNFPHSAHEETEARKRVYDLALAHAASVARRYRVDDQDGAKFTEAQDVQDQVALLIGRGIEALRFDQPP